MWPMWAPGNVLEQKKTFLLLEEIRKYVFFPIRNELFLYMMNKADRFLLSGLASHGPQTGALQMLFQVCIFRFHLILHGHCGIWYTA